MKKTLVAVLIIAFAIIASAALPPNAAEAAKEIVSLLLSDASEAKKLTTENNLLRFFGELELNERQIEKYLETQLSASVLENLQKRQEQLLQGKKEANPVLIDPLEKTETALKRKLLWLSFAKGLSLKQRAKLQSFNLSGFIYIPQARQRSKKTMPHIIRFSRIPTLPNFKPEIRKEVMQIPQIKDIFKKQYHLKLGMERRGYYGFQTQSIRVHTKSQNKRLIRYWYRSLGFTRWICFDY